MILTKKKLTRVGLPWILCSPVYNYQMNQAAITPSLYLKKKITYIHEWTMNVCLFVSTVFCLNYDTWKNRSLWITVLVLVPCSPTRWRSAPSSLMWPFPVDSFLLLYMSTQRRINIAEGGIELQFNEKQF